MNGDRALIQTALNAKTTAAVGDLVALIEARVGGRHERPIGDTDNNRGLISAGGASFDHKMIELVTNMQDAVLERAALQRFGKIDLVPYASPAQAAQDLFPGLDYQETAERISVEFHESDPPTSRTRRLTAVFRDHGVGLCPSQIPRTIFRLGSSHKPHVSWFQGAYGVGGATTYRNAKAVVLVTRRAPELLNGEEDRITVTVLTMRQYGKNASLCYLVESMWEEGRNPLPPSVPASAMPEFEPGTHLALVSYGVEGVHRASARDPKSFSSVIDTRLFRPILPVRWDDHIHAKADRRYLRGLARRLNDSDNAPRSGEDTLPFRSAQTVYHLPVRWWVFEDRKARDAYVAHDHALLFTSNGQTHHHWTPQAFKSTTKLPRLADRILVEVDTDELPIEVRSALFTADRAGMVRSDDAVRIEREVVAFLNDQHELRERHSAIIRETLRGGTPGRLTRHIADRISKALEFPGYGGGGTTGGGGGGRGTRPSRPPVAPPVLYTDPTALEGPAEVVAELDHHRFITYTLNAQDEFFDRHGAPEITIDYPGMTERDVTVGQLRGGRFRVTLALPSEGDTGVFSLKVTIPPWVRANGGLSKPLEWVTKVTVVTEAEPRPAADPGPKKGASGADGRQVAFRWTSHEAQEGWTAKTVGDVEEIAAADLAAEKEEYAELAAMGDTPVPTLSLNEEYHPLKKYLDQRGLAGASAEGIDSAKERYAVAVGVGLLLLAEERAARQAKGELTDDALLHKAFQAVAQGAVTILPDFHRLADQFDFEE